MKPTLILFLLFLSTFAQGGTRITTTVEYKEVFTAIDKMGKEYGPENVLVVFDIDDTLLVIEHCKKPDGTWTRGIGKLFSCPSVHTEAKLSHELERVQKEGFSTIALTARGSNLISATKRELKRKHDGQSIFTFKEKPFVTDLESIKVERTKRCKKDEVPPCLSGKFSHKPKFLEGVMYTNGTNKGLALKALLSELGVSYQAIVFVDDRNKNTKNVDEVYKDQDIVDVQSFLYLRHRD